MVLSAHELRRHLPKRAARVICVALLKLLRNAQTGDPEISFRNKHKIIRFDILMNDLIFVNILQPYEYIGQKQLGLPLINKALVS